MRPREKDEQLLPLCDATLASVFGQMKPYRPDPAKGRLRQLTPDQEKELRGKLQVKAPAEWKERYMKLFVDYHDACSRNKMDLGHADVVEHKIVMKDQEPVHTRQFKVPFEHEEVLHNYVDELLRQGAIEVSRSPYNSPVFCVAKKVPPDAPPGTKPPLRCVLDFRQVNALSLIHI